MSVLEKVKELREVTGAGMQDCKNALKENNNDIRLKLKCAQKSGLKIVLCIGEPIEEYNAGTTKLFLEQQLVEALGSIVLTTDLIVAYEPIWAIGSGKLPSTSEINSIHIFIKDIVQSASKNNFIPKVIYGGSVSSKNAEALFKEQDIDGALIGGASLKGKEFALIANHYKNRGF